MRRLLQTSHSMFQEDPYNHHADRKMSQVPLRLRLSYIDHMCTVPYNTDHSVCRRRFPLDSERIETCDSTFLKKKVLVRVTLISLHGERNFLGGRFSDLECLLGSGKMKKKKKKKYDNKVRTFALKNLSLFNLTAITDSSSLEL